MSVTGPTTEDLTKILEEGKELFEKTFSIKMNYYPQSLKKLEVALNDMFPFPRPQPVSSPVIILVGAYLGEVIKRNIKQRNVSVKWIEPKDESFDFSLEVSGAKLSIEQADDASFILKPMVLVDKFLNYDRTDSIWAMYCMVQDICHGRINLDTNGTWKGTPRGYGYRSIKVDKENI